MKKRDIHLLFEAPSYPVLLPYEALAIWKNTETRDVKLYSLRKNIEEDLHPITLRELSTIEATRSPISKTNFSNISVALKKIVHRKEKIPWTELTDERILSIWKLFFVNKYNAKINMKDCLKLLDLIKDLIAQNEEDVSWDKFMIKYSCLTVQFFMRNANDPKDNLDDYIDNWRDATKNLICKLCKDAETEEWAKILSWRLTINYIAFEYNLYFRIKQGILKDHNEELYNVKDILEKKCLNLEEIYELIEEQQFSNRANKYANYLQSPQAYFNLIAYNSCILGKYDEFPEQWNNLQQSIDYILSLGGHRNQIKSLHYYICELFNERFYDTDLESFRKWFESNICKNGIRHWYEEKCERCKYWRVLKQINADSIRGIKFGEDKG